ncbi:hypothetical protein CO051_04200 [Candidatus Roizmanbacteria bacterium CG_4_9_14_0_2_um_filter_39_13]|uniref:Tyrosine specific protein phosphatases domain-containing protein n=1 Tax=Candidatus Roizmanbacteria bacterium CG_4_9_14_0_2_um_filter_39_13 TaxID=1974839 RepID=A0A2M8EYB5_9BACT|nr:MAG: hypothetical protein CO051_04200 [Candidatus Roizmanbacteria bacterium CG_4_9_14_0_2_um_filter_39_13]
MQHTHITDYSHITPLIILGSDLCKGWKCPVHSEEFRKLGIHTEINLETEHDEPVAPELDVYLRLPTPDETAPTQEQLLIATDALQRTIKSNKKAYVHCKNGHGRSPTVVAAYFIRFEHKNVDEAVNLIKNKRPEIHINKIQFEALEEFRREVVEND